MQIARSAQQCETVVHLAGGQQRYAVGSGQLLLGAVLPATESFALLLPLLEQLQQQRFALLCYRPARKLPPTLDLDFCRQLRHYTQHSRQLLMGRVDDCEQLEALADFFDLVEIEAAGRPHLCAAAARLGRPVLLQRGLATSMAEWLRCAEWLYSNGCPSLILGEQGYQLPGREHTLLDLALIHQVRQASHLPLLVDATLCCGDRQLLRQTTASVVASDIQALLIPVQVQDIDQGPALGPEQRSEVLASLSTLCRFFQQPLTLLARIPSPPTTPTLHAAHLRVGFQGEEGAFSEQALLQYFQQQEPQGVPYASFREVFQAIRAGEVQAGVLPMENTLGGTLIENYALLRRYSDLRISGELRLRIKHNLIACPGVKLEDVRVVRSHPQALAQCDVFIEQLHLRREAVYDTAGAVKVLASIPETRVAAIAGSRAAAVYGMNILQTGIETNHQNYTRFVVVERAQQCRDDGANKVSLVLTASHQIGSLAAVLNILTQEGFDLTKLESHPIYGEPWRYHFFIDARTPASYNFEQLQRQLQSHVLELFQLGHYLEDNRIYNS